MRDPYERFKRLFRDLDPNNTVVPDRGGKCVELFGHLVQTGRSYIVRLTVVLDVDITS